MRCPHNAGEAIQRWAEIVVVEELGRPSVERHAHWETVLKGPVYAHQSKLTVDCGIRSRGRRFKGTVETIAGRLENMAAEIGHDLGHDFVVPPQGSHHRRGVAFPPLRASSISVKRNVTVPLGSRAGWSIRIHNNKLLAAVAVRHNTSR